MSYDRSQAIEKYGWTAVPHKVSALLAQSQATTPTPPITVSSLRLPDTPLAKAVYEYAKKELAVKTFNHSMRAYYYGQAILAHAFPTWSTPSFNETYFLTSLLHDIGTTDTNIHNSLLSFEYHGGLLIHSLLSSLSAPVPQTEQVIESVIRHQDLGDEGSITRIGALIQLATIFDNMGGQPQLVAKETIEDVVKHFPRDGWSKCFAETVRRENGLKPWAHTTALGVRAFPEGVENNELMAPYDG